MTTADFVLLATFVGATLYIIYRLVLGWFYTRSEDSTAEELDEVNGPLNDPDA